MRSGAKMRRRRRRTLGPTQSCEVVPSFHLLFPQLPPRGLRCRYSLPSSESGPKAVEIVSEIRGLFPKIKAYSPIRFEAMLFGVIFRFPRREALATASALLIALSDCAQHEFSSAEDGGE